MMTSSARPPRTSSSSALSTTGTPSSSSTSHHAGVLLGAAATENDRRERETMNLKLEIAHLRERLLLRVGGDTTAAELEAENFALKASLLDAQEAHARTTKTLQTLDAKYAKALSNLVKMDHAWKSSLADAKRARVEIAQRDAAIADAEQRLQQLQQSHDEDTTKRQTLNDYQVVTIQTLEAQLAAKATNATSQLDQLQRLTLRVKELESELETVRRQQQQSDKQSISTVHRDEYDALQKQLQQAKEDAATLRGETNALRTERSSLQTQLSDTKASLTAAMAKFLQLKEDNATLEVHVTAAKEASEQSARDAVFFKGEVDRIQKELTKKEQEMLQLERSAQVLERRLAQQQKLTEDAKATRDHAAKRLELQHELSWKDREFALENELRAFKQQCAETKCELETLQQHHAELKELLINSDEGNASDATDDLKTMVMTARARRNEALLLAQQHQKTASRLEKEVAKSKALADEHAALQAEFEKTRRAMERIVGRKTKAATNTQRATGGSSTPTTVPPTTTSTASASSTTSSFSTYMRNSLSSASSSFMRSALLNKETSGSAPPAATTLGTKRKLELSDRTTTPTKADVASLFSPGKKRLIHVQSRYMQPLKR